MNDARFEQFKDTVYSPLKIQKSWGYELVLWNTPEYCGQVLIFRCGANFSMHFHINKLETWYVRKGIFRLHLIKDSEKTIHTLNVGDCITIAPGTVHQIFSLEEGSTLFEVSTEHYNSDSYRIFRNSPQEIL